jgi:hypothetical protein
MSFATPQVGLPVPDSPTFALAPSHSVQNCRTRADDRLAHRRNTLLFL